MNLKKQKKMNRVEPIRPEPTDWFGVLFFLTLLDVGGLSFRRVHHQIEKKSSPL